MTDAAAQAGPAGSSGPGRPRDERIDRAIVEAALELIDAGTPVTLSRLVATSGVSRAALYRRWPSLTTLVADALNVGRETPGDVPDDADLGAFVLASWFDGESAGVARFPEHRFRHRIRLAMSDRDLQRAYWESHVRPRREPLERALRERVRRGELRADLDVESAFDLIVGVFYYQLIVRGEEAGSPVTEARVRAAFDVVWNGMRAPSPPDQPSPAEPSPAEP